MVCIPVGSPVPDLKGNPCAFKNFMASRVCLITPELMCFCPRRKCCTKGPSFSALVSEISTRWLRSLPFCLLFPNRALLSSFHLCCLVTFATNTEASSLKVCKQMTDRLIGMQYGNSCCFELVGAAIISGAWKQNNGIFTCLA